MSSHPVVVLGDVMVDVVATADGPLQRASDTAATVSFAGGGSAANTAAWLVHAGVRALLVGRVGDDLAGREQRAGLERAGVEARLAVDPWQPTGTCVVVVEPGGERTMLPDRGANLELAATDLPDAAFAPGGHLHVSGYALLHPGPRAAALAALARAHDAGMTTSVDPSSSAPLRALGAREFLELVAGVGLLLPNADEAAVLTGLDDAPAAAHALALRTGAEVVVTAGPHAIHSDGDSVTDVAAPTLVPVDSTGAGDAFAAGLLAARRTGAAPGDQLRAAHAIARAAVRRVGARPALPPLLHVATREAWDAAQVAREYAIGPGAPFVHLCLPHQLDGVLDRFFADPGELVLLTLDDSGLDVRFEPAADGAGDFPHLYGTLPLSAVRDSGPLIR